MVFITAALVRSVSAFMVSVVLHGLFVRVVVATRDVVLLRFVTRIALMIVLRLVMSGVSWVEVMLPVAAALMMRDFSPFRWGLVVVRSGTVVLGLMLRLVVAVLVVVRVGCSDFLRVGVVVASLGDDVVLLRSGHSEVLRLVFFALIVVSIILVTMSVLRGHVVVVWVLIVVRLIGVSLVILVSGRVVTFVMGILNMSVLCGSDVTSLVGNLTFVMVGFTLVGALVVHGGSVVGCLVMDGSGVVGCLMMDRSDVTRSFVMDGCSVTRSFVVNWLVLNMFGGFVVDGSLMVNRSFVMDGSGMTRSFVMDWLVLNVLWSLVANWSSMMRCLVVDGSNMLRSLVMDWLVLDMLGSLVMNWSCMVGSFVMHGSNMLGCLVMDGGSVAWSFVVDGLRGLVVHWGSMVRCLVVNGSGVMGGLVMHRL